MLLCRVGVTLLVLTAATTGSRAQAPPMVPLAAAAKGGGSGTLPASPSVLTGYRFSAGDAGLAKLEALVLWRGAPPWQNKRTNFRGSSVSGGSVSGWTATGSYGSFQLTASSDAIKSTLIVQGQTFDLSRTNVILVDAVDTSSGPVIIDTFRIDAQVPSIVGVDILLPVFKAIPELREFLRCGVAGPKTIPPMSDLCGKLTP